MAKAIIESVFCTGQRELQLSPGQQRRSVDVASSTAAPFSPTTASSARKVDPHLPLKEMGQNLSQVGLNTLKLQ